MKWKKEIGLNEDIHWLVINHALIFLDKENQSNLPPTISSEGINSVNQIVDGFECNQCIFHCYQDRTFNLIVIIIRHMNISFFN